MGSFATPPPGGAGKTGSIVLSLVVDTSTGQVTIKDFDKLIDQITQKWSQLPPAPNPAAIGGWAVVSNQTLELLERVKGLTDKYKDLLVESTILASQAQVMQTTLTVTSKNMNIQTSAALAQAQAVKSMNITWRESLGLVAQFERAQLDLAKATDLARAAQDLAVISGTNSSETLGTLVQSIQNQEVITLRQFGIVTQSQIVFDRYAASINRTAASLTATEKRQAFLNYILEEGEKVAGAYSSAMEDAGKQMTSLARLTEDAQVSIGRNFLPTMNLVIKVMTWFLEELPKVNSTVVVLTGSFIALGLAVPTVTFAVGALTAAVAALRTGALAAGAAGTVMRLGFGWIGIAITLFGTLAIAAVNYYEKQQMAAKDALEAGQAEQAHLVRLNELKQKSLDLEERKQKLAKGDVQVQPQAGRSDDEAKALAIAEETASIARNESAVQKTAKEINELYGDITGSAEQRAAVLAKIAKDEAQTKKNINEQLWVVRDELSAALKDEAAQKSRVQVLTENAAFAEKVFGDNSLVSVKAAKDLVEQEKKLDDAKKLVANRQAMINELSAKRSGKSLEDVNFTATVSQLQAAAAAQNQLNGLMRSGAGDANAVLAVMQQEKQSVQALDSYTRGIVGGLEAQVDQQHQIVTSVFASTAARKEAAEKEKQYTSELGVATDYQKQITTIVNSRNKNEGQKAIEAAKTLLKLGAEHKDVMQDGSRAAGNLYEALAQTANVYQGMVTAAQALSKQQSQNANEVRQQHINSIQAGVQSIESRQQVLDIEEDITKENLKQMFVGTGMSQLQRDEITAYLKAIELHKQDLLLKEQEDKLAQDVVATMQATLGFGASYEDQTKAVEARYNLELKMLNETYKGSIVLADLQSNLAKRQTAEVEKLAKARADALVQAKQQLIDLLMQPVQQRMSAGADTKEDRVALHKYWDDQKELEMQAYERSEQIARLQKGTDEERTLAVDLLHAKQKQLDEDRNQKEREYEAMMRGRANEHAQIALQLKGYDVALGQARKAEIDDVTRKAAIDQQIADLKAKEYISESEIERIRVEGYAASERQLKIDQDQAKLDTARRLSANTGPAVASGAYRESGKEMYQMAKDTEQAIASLNQKFKDGDTDIENYSLELERLQNNLRSTDEILQALVQGLPTTPLEDFRLGWEHLAVGINAAWDALLEGNNVAQAFKKAIGDMMKAESKMLMGKAIEHLGYGLVALTPWGAPLYGPASNQFMAAGLFAAGAAVMGGVGAAIGGGSGGGSSAGTSAANSAQNLAQTAQPVATSTRIEDNIVRLSNVLEKNGRVIADSGAPLNALSTKFIEAAEQNKDPQPIAQAVGAAVGDKMAAATNTTNQTNTALLTDIHAELVKSNQKDMTVSVTNEVTLDSDSMNTLMEDGFLSNTQKYNRVVAQEVSVANAENATRKDQGRALGNGGV